MADLEKILQDKAYELLKDGKVDLVIGNALLAYPITRSTLPSFNSS